MKLKLVNQQALLLQENQIKKLKADLSKYAKPKDTKESKIIAKLLQNEREKSPPKFLNKPFYEINIDEIVFDSKITEGGYGIVYVGKWHGTQVAIKEVKHEYVSQEKLQEFYSR